MVVGYEELKAYFKAGRENGRQHFFLALHTEIPLREKLQQYYDYRRARREELDRILHGEDGTSAPPKQNKPFYRREAASFSPGLFMWAGPISSCLPGGCQFAVAYRRGGAFCKA